MSMERTTQEIEGTASWWLIRRDSGAWTAEDEKRFTAWLAASTLHRVAFLRLEAAWESAARLKALGAGVPGDLPPTPGKWNLSPFFEPHGAALPRPRSTKVRRGRWRALALAASVLITIGIAVDLVMVQGGRRYTTAIGRIESVAVPDGSKVTLNTDSEIRVRLTETERRVDLDKGEAFFAVAKDPNRPFIVDAGEKRVIAIGTQFSVRRDGNEIEIVVTEGQVRVVDGGEALLTPGSIARAGDAGILVRRETLGEAEDRLSWRSGVLRFRDERLSEIVAEFNRYNERKIVIADPTVAALKIEGDFRATSLDAFVRLLESSFPVHATSSDGHIVLTSTVVVTP
jgi:transmembrane sensor